MIKPFYIFALLFAIYSQQLDGQTTVNYFDSNYLEESKQAKTSFKRSFITSKDSIVAKAYRKDTLLSQGVFYGFSNYKEIAPFEIYHKTQNIVKLKSLRLKKRFAIIELYEKGIKKALVKYENGNVYTLQRWLNNKPALEDGSGIVLEEQDSSIQVETFENFKRIKAITIRKQQGDTLYFQSDKAAIPPSGSIYGFHKDVKSTFKYPKTARKKNKEAIVYLYFIVDKTGSLTELRVLNKNEVDKTFVNLIETKSYQLQKWVPAFHDGKPVKTAFQVKLQFILR
ncbi:energy transducer TonB [Roseivirga pacifica]|uniref:energy transducer TonB n=1 Tax=Roseivirga pacifica TaxID=1267423 RepID=UPI003BB0B8DD